VVVHVALLPDPRGGGERAWFPLFAHAHEVIIVREYSKHYVDHALLNAHEWIGTPEVVVIPFFSLSWAWERGQQGSGSEGNRDLGVRLLSSRCYIPAQNVITCVLSNRMNILETLCFQRCRETYPDCYRNAITITVQFRVHFK